MSRFARVGLFLLKAAGFLLSILFLLLLLLNTSLVQNRITGYAETYLSQKTNAAITVEKISINFLGNLLIQEVLIPDRQKDTLLHLGRLEVGFQLREIFRKRIRIDKVALEDVTVHVHPEHDTVMNYQFLIDAFAGDPDDQPGTAENGEGSSWRILLPNARLSLADIQADYRMPDSVLMMRARIGSFEVKTNQADMIAGQFDLDGLSLEDSKFFLKMAADTTDTPPDTSGSAFPLDLKIVDLTFVNVGYRMEMDDFLIDSHVGSALAENNQMFMGGDSMRIDIAQFDLEGSRYRMETPSAPAAPGLDYNHLDFDDIQIRVSDFKYDNLDITAQVRQIAGRDHSGFELTDFSTRVQYTLDSIELEALHAATPRTRINANHGKVTFPFLQDSSRFEDMRIEIEVDSTHLSPVDIAYFAPALAEQALFRHFKHKNLHLDARVYGTLADLRVQAVEFQGWGIRANLSGRLQHVTEMDRLVTDLHIGAIEIAGADAIHWLPPATIPDYMELPERLLLQGTVRGPLRKTDLQLEATTSRPALPVAARLQLDGTLYNPTSTDRLAYDLAVDTLWVSREEMSCYLPDSFPAYIELPEAIALGGIFRGRMDTVFTDLRLEAFRGGAASEIRLAGRVDRSTNTDALRYELDLRELILQAEEIAAYLPDSTFPAYVRLPMIEQAKGEFKGDLTNIDGRLSLRIPEGTLQAAVQLQDSAYVASLDLENFHVQSLFQDPVAFDSVVGWPAPPVAVEVRAEGRGLDVEQDLLADASVRLRFQGDTIRWREGLVLEGRIDRQSFRGQLRAQERELALDLSVLADFNPGMDTTALAGSIGKVDLAGLNAVQVPFEISTALDFQGRGRSLDSIRVDLKAKNFFIRYDSVSESTEQLQILFKRIAEENLLAGVIRSDFITAYGIDQASFPQVFNPGLDTLLRKLNLERTQLEMNQDSTKNLFAALTVSRPEIFTSGLVPGLTELEPVELIAAVDMQDSSFAVYGDVPHVKYQGIETDSVVIEGVNWDKLFLTQLTVGHADFFDQIQVQGLVFYGFSRSTDTLFFVLQQKDSLLAPSPQQPERFKVVAYSLPDSNNYRFRFHQKPIFNYDTLWRFDPANQIVYGKSGLQIDNLRLFKDQQSLSIDGVDKTGIDLSFRNFDLQFFSDIIKWKSDYLMGVVDGTVAVVDPLDSLRLSTNLDVADLSLLTSPLGDLEIVAANTAEGVLNAEVKLQGAGNDIALSASYRPAEPAAPFTGQLRTSPLNLAALGPFLSGYLSEIDGGVHTDLTFSGNLQKPVVMGEMNLQEVYFKPVATGSRLEVPAGTLRFSKDIISSQKEILLRDSLGREATLGLAVQLDNYPELRYATQLQASNFLLLNLPPNDTALYYGTIFGDVTVNVAGSTSEAVNINCRVTPREGSSVVYVYDQGSAAENLKTGEGMVEFLDFETMKTDSARVAQKVRKRTGGYNLDVSATLDDNLDLTVIMDRETGDRLEGMGDGTVVFKYPSQGEMEMTGQLDVSGSKYFFTYEGVIKKEFEIQDGSTLTFVGPVDNPSLSLKAGYNAKTPPEPLVNSYGDAGGASVGSLKRRQEFLVTVQVEGTLEEAELNSDIQYPRKPGNENADLVDPALGKLRGNPSEMNTQAFSLVLFNSFRLSGAAGSGGSLINLKQQMGDLISSQLNNLAGQYVNFVELDFGIETLSDDWNNINFEDTEFRIGVKKRLFQDRLLIEVDGSVNTGNDQPTNMQSFFDNVAVEYALNPSGGLRLRAFNQYDTDDFIAGNVLKIGGALLISKDFNRLFFKKHFQQPVLSSSDNPETVPDSMKMGKNSRTDTMRLRQRE